MLIPSYPSEKRIVKMKRSNMTAMLTSDKIKTKPGSKETRVTKLATVTASSNKKPIIK